MSRPWYVRTFFRLVCQRSSRNLDFLLWLFERRREVFRIDDALPLPIESLLSLLLMYCAAGKMFCFLIGGALCLHSSLGLFCLLRFSICYHFSHLLLPGNPLAVCSCWFGLLLSIRAYCALPAVLLDRHIRILCFATGFPIYLCTLGLLYPQLVVHAYVSFATICSFDLSRRALWGSTALF